ncbi:TPA: hypothetical protein ACPQXP_000865 [Streptococcus mutans]
MELKTEKNPLKILYISKNDLLPTSIWIVYSCIIFLLIILTFVIPDRFVKVNYNVFNSNQFILLAISALAFVLSMYTFGREVYQVKDFENLYLKKREVYYNYLANYIFPSMLWCIILILSVLKMILIVSVPFWVVELSQIFFFSMVLLALIATVSLVIRNMNRVTNKVIIESKKISSK